MKLLSTVAIFACVALSFAVPLNHADEESDFVTQQDLADVVETIDAMETVATDSQLYFLRKVKDAFKRAVKRGVRVEVKVRPNYAMPDTDLTPEGIEQFFEVLDKLSEQDMSSTTYFGKKFRRGLKKIGKAIEKGAKKVLEKGVSVNVPF